MLFGFMTKSCPCKAKPSRVKAVMKWWTKCISMVIAKTASRNVAFKSDKIMDALFQGQSGAQTPQSVFDADFEILASNSEVYIFDQDDSQEVRSRLGLNF